MQRIQIFPQERGSQHPYIPQDEHSQSWHAFCSKPKQGTIFTPTSAQSLDPNPRRSSFDWIACAFVPSPLASWRLRGDSNKTKTCKGLNSETTPPTHSIRVPFPSHSLSPHLHCSAKSPPLLCEVKILLDPDGKEKLSVASSAAASAARARR